jgi:hypothetical protein
MMNGTATDFSRMQSFPLYCLLLPQVLLLFALVRARNAQRRRRIADDELRRAERNMLRAKLLNSGNSIPDQKLAA